jgi:hypothetical protein
MADMRAIARGFLFVASIALTCGLGRSAKADDPGYVPDGPNFPTITLNEGPEGAPGLPPLKVPPPKGWDKQSTWNMQVVGFNDGQGRPSSDDGWVENQNGRYIVYMTSTGGNGNNPLTGRVENSGTSLIDATDPAHPVYLANVATKSDKGAPHVAVCGGNHFPNAEANGLLNRWFMIRHDGNDDWEIWETTDPAHPKLLTTILSNGVNSHHAWWECDTGIVGINISEFSHYIGSDLFKLYKLHGSVHWAREIETVLHSTRTNEQPLIRREIIDTMPTLTISERFRMIGSYETSSANEVALFPALALPVEVKSRFECPDEHLASLRAHLPKVTKILVVGWRGAEKHFLALLKEHLPSGIPIQVVAGTKQAADSTIAQLGAAGIDMVPEALDGGFSEYVGSRDAERFFHG